MGTIASVHSFWIIIIMGKLQNLTLATAISILGLNAIEIPDANASVLSVGKYASISKKLKLLSLLQRQQTIAELSQGNKTLINTIEQLPELSSSIERRSSPNMANDQLQKLLTQTVNNLASVEALQTEIVEYTETLPVQSPTTESISISNLPNADKINQNIRDRYYGLVEGEEEIGLIETQKILGSTDNEIGAELNAGTLENINEAELEQAVEVLQSQEIATSIISAENEVIDFPKPLLFGLLFLICSPIISMFAALGISVVEAMNEGFLGDIKEKYGKPQVPEGSVALHNRSLKEITTIGNKAERINDNKFGNEEFLLLLQIKIDISKDTEGYEQLNNGVELLKAAIIAQKSFLRLEQTELRYLDISYG